MKITIRIAAFLLLAVTPVFSQNSRVGTWKSHLPNKIVNSVAAVGNIIYTGGPQTFFTFNSENGSINYNSKYKGFAGSSISKLGYSKETNTIVIAYDDSNIDLINGTTVTKVNDILKSGIVGSKKVNHLYFYKDKAYFSTDYGLLIYNLVNQQVEDVCKMFKAGNNNTEVRSSTILNDTIYVTSSQGVFFAPVSNDVNKLDYRNWKEINTSDLNLDATFFFIASIDNRVYMANETRLEILENGKFIVDPLLSLTLPVRKFQGLKNIEGKLWILQSNSIVSYKSGLYTLISEKANPIDITIDKENQVWIADLSVGLLKLVNNEVEMIKTNGPYSNYAFQLYSYQNKMMILTGAYNYEFYGNYGRPYGYSILEKGIWSNYSFLLKNMPLAYDICSARFNPFSNKLFFASYSNGLVEWNLNTNEFKVMNRFVPGNPIHGSSTFLGSADGPSSDRVPDVAVDNKGTVWVLNTPDPNIGNASIFKYDLTGKWDSISWVGNDQWGSYNYSPLSTASFFLHKIFIDKNNNKWFASRLYSPDPSSQIGLFVYNEDKSPLPRYLKYEKDKTNEICGKQVYCISQDLDGAIWIGTENGVCFFPDPEEIFLRKAVKATTPIINNLPLLKGKRVTGIDFDGSNRKWISTSTDGLLLVSADGSKIITSFNENNSPLITSSVNDVKVDRLTGEVFVATDDGVFSYNGLSVDANDNNENVRAYPNPLKSDYNGYFTVDGLVNKAIIKITDISGKLLFEGKAEGSRFTWNVKDYNGKRPDSGIYLIYSSKDDGSEHLLTKIAILD